MTSASRQAGWMRLLLGAAILGSCTPGSTGNTPWVSHTNARYGYTLEYPDTLDLQEYTPAYLELGRRDGEAFTAAVQIAVETGDEEDLQAFTVERAQAACAADGPDLSLQCTGVEEIRTVSASGELQGVVFHLRHLTTRPGTDEVVERGRRGPFFAYVLPARASSGETAVLFVRAPVILSPEEVDTATIRRIAESVRLH